MLKGLMMGLMECCECGGKVSRNADSCPHCGSKKYGDYPDPTPHPTKLLTKWKYMSTRKRLLLIFFFGCCIALVVGSIHDLVQNALRQDPDDWEIRERYNY